MELPVHFLCLLTVFRQVVTANYPEQRIYGGESVDVSEIPYVVALVHKKGYQVCGGSIITIFHILTAAHCVVTPPDFKEQRRKAPARFARAIASRDDYDYDNYGDYDDYDYDNYEDYDDDDDDYDDYDYDDYDSDDDDDSEDEYGVSEDYYGEDGEYLPENAFFIFAGATDLRDPASVRSIRDIISHEDFDPSTTGNDIALIMVHVPFLWSNEIYRIPLSYPNFEVYEPVPAIVSGYGITYVGQEDAVFTLQSVQVWAISNDYCQYFYAESGQHISKEDMCTYCWQGKGSCVGDSGGPVVVDGRLVGIVAWGQDECASTDYPTGNTRVSSFLDWIQISVTAQMLDFQDDWGWKAGEKPKKPSKSNPAGKNKTKSRRRLPHGQ